MKKVGFVLTLMMIILLGFWVWAVLGSNQAPAVQQPQSQLFNTQSSDKGDVVVEVTPVKLEFGKEAKFKVAMDTHSVELSYDLLKVASLTDDQGNSLKPLSWNGGSGGHHLNGELVFPSISAKAKVLELKLSNISNFDRLFKWSLT